MSADAPPRRLPTDPVAADRPTTEPLPDGSGPDPGGWSVADRVVVGGVGFDPVTEAEVIDRVFDCLAAGRGGFLVTPNVDILRQLRRPDLRELVATASVVVADGMPVVWASRIAGNPLPARVAGATLVPALTERAAGCGRSVFLLGGDPGIAERAAARLADRYPGLQVAGWHFPPFGYESDPAARAAITAALRTAAPDLVFAGLGFPRQERLIASLRQDFPATWFVGCGGALAMAAGAVSRAPAWAQRHGLEWAHRLSREPRRLVRRYLVDDAPFAAGLLARSAAQRLRPRVGR